ncbi:uncharacterized protein [Ptychodera flava]|uniref:uncharacterized protein isoform X2 n=1 Tax=Ptychodera flava TaxID=63121 RepID=UPI003969CD83
MIHFSRRYINLRGGHSQQYSRMCKGQVMWLRGYQYVLILCTISVIIFLLAFDKRLALKNLLNGPAAKETKHIRIGVKKTEDAVAESPIGDSSKLNKSGVYPTEQDLPNKHGAYSTTIHNSETQYLLPTKTKTSGGANSQYNRLKSAIILSMLTNRTLVLNPFFLHGGQVRGYTAEHLRSFQDTFDVEILSELVPVASIEEYKQTCNQSSIQVIGWDIDKTHYEKANQAIYGDILNMNLPPYDEAFIFDAGIEIGKIRSKLNDEPCVAYSLDGFFGAKLGKVEKGEIEKVVSKYLVRSQTIRHVVDSISEEVCDGDRYLAFHWRNKSAEMPCFFHGGKGEKADLCTSSIREIREAAYIAVDAIVDLMARERINCIYVACPLWSMKIIDIFAERMPRQNIFNSLRLPDTGKFKRYLQDYYFMSLIEQEIAYRAEIFISAGHSNWSQFVSEGRAVRERVTYNIHDLADFPESVSRNMVR